MNEPTALEQPKIAAGQGSASKSAATSASTSQVERLLDVCSEIELFHTPDDREFTSIQVADHVECFPLKSIAFRHWLINAYRAAYHKPPSPNSVSSAIEALRARARFSGETTSVFVRSAEHDGRIYYNLADRDHNVVEISPAGWRVTQEPPVHFWKPAGLLPLPLPAEGSSLDAVRSVLNFGTEEQWRLMAGWVLGAVQPRGPYPLLAIHGEQGSAKSTTARVLRRLLDPNEAELRAEPQSVRDLVIAANNSWVISLDNLSRLPGWLSDALCRLSTGGGFATRELYTDDLERIFDVQRPVILNGIEELATRSDLLERSIVIELPLIDVDRRRTERALWERIKETDLPQMTLPLKARMSGLSSASF